MDEAVGPAPMDGTETTGERFIDDADGVTPARCTNALGLPAPRQPQQGPLLPKYIIDATRGVANVLSVTLKCARRAVSGKPRSPQRRRSTDLVVRLVALVQLCFTYGFVRWFEHFMRAACVKE
jgi:hypothetical protein